MSEVRYYEGIGRRKRATARVRLYPGDGQIAINDKPLDQYFGRFQDRQQAIEPLKLTNNEGRYNLMVVVNGGGITGQAQAIRMGLARALADRRSGIARHAARGWLPYSRFAGKGTQEGRPQEGRGRHLNTPSARQVLHADLTAT